MAFLRHFWSYPPGKYQFPANKAIHPPPWKRPSFLQRLAQSSRGVGPHAIYTCSEETLLRARGLAKKYDAMLHIHLSETKGEVEDSLKRHGQSPVEYMDTLGFLSNRLVAAHCIWLSDRDISLLARRGTNVAHCPVSNLKMAAGIAPIVSLQKAGVNVCLGADGASSNNNLSLFEEMKTMAIVQKTACSRPDVVLAEVVWKIATEGIRTKSGIARGSIG